MTDETKGLKACPFCGAAPEYYTVHGRAAARCPGADCVGGGDREIDQWFWSDVWNRRALVDGAPEPVAWAIYDPKNKKRRPPDVRVTEPTSEKMASYAKHGLRVAALVDGASEPTATEALSSVCAICYHALDRCSHCDAPPRDGAQTDTARLATTISAIAAERERQKSVEGWTEAHDDAHVHGELAIAAARYAVMHSDAVVDDPDDATAGWIKPTVERGALVKAGALIVAEIERLDRAAMQAAPAHDEHRGETDDA